MYFELAKAVSEHIRSAENLEKTLNDTLSLLYCSDIDAEIKKSLVHFATY